MVLKTLGWLIRFLALLWLYEIWVFGVKTVSDGFVFIAALTIYTSLWFISYKIQNVKVRSFGGWLYLLPQLIYFLLAITSGYKNHVLELAILISFYPIIWHFGNRIISRATLTSTGEG